MYRFNLMELIIISGDINCQQYSTISYIPSKTENGENSVWSVKLIHSYRPPQSCEVFLILNKCSLCNKMVYNTFVIGITLILL